MNESEQAKIRRQYAAALKASEQSLPELPGVTVYRGTMLIKADGTEYHYDDDWCKAEDLKELSDQLQRYRQIEKTIEVVPGWETDEHTWVRASRGRCRDAGEPHPPRLRRARISCFRRRPGAAL